MRKVRKEEKKVEAIEVTKEAQINEEIVLEPGDQVRVVKENNKNPILDLHVDSYDYSGHMSREAIAAADRMEAEGMDITDAINVFDDTIIDELRSKATFRNEFGNVIDFYDYDDKYSY